MRAVNRNDATVPDSMTGNGSAASKELLKLKAHFTSTDPKKSSPTFKVYKSPHVKQQLDALFHGKCAYCESFYASTTPVDVEHYRPKGAVHEDATHPGYWWLAMEWDNLLPSCIDCNRKRKQITPIISTSLLTLLKDSSGFSHSRTLQTGKKDSFPILGQRVLSEATDLASEHALLIDPCRDDPEQHLRFHIDRLNLISLVLPQAHAAAGLPAAAADPGKGIELDSIMEQALADGLSLKGAVSIHVYGLNRLGLVQERTRLLRQLEFLEMLALEVGVMADKLFFEPSSARSRKRDLSIANRLYFLQDQVLSEMKLMAKPDAPYSAMVREWIKGFKARLRS